MAAQVQDKGEPVVSLALCDDEKQAAARSMCKQPGMQVGPACCPTNMCTGNSQVHFAPPTPMCHCMQCWTKVAAYQCPLSTLRATHGPSTHHPCKHAPVEEKQNHGAGITNLVFDWSTIWRTQTHWRPQLYPWLSGCRPDLNMEEVMDQAFALVRCVTCSHGPRLCSGALLNPEVVDQAFALVHCSPLK